MKESPKLKYFILLHIIVFLYSLGGIASKNAAKFPFFSWQFVLLYGLVLLNLAFYALMWQQVLKHIPLTTAYANKSVTILWGMLIGFFVFDEEIKLSKILGAAIVLVGICLVVTSDE